jgi:hypothetical protein
MYPIATGPNTKGYKNKIEVSGYYLRYIIETVVDGV